MFTNRRILGILLTLCMLAGLLTPIPTLAAQAGYNIPNTNLYITGGKRDYDWQLLSEEYTWTLVLLRNAPVTLTGSATPLDNPTYGTVLSAATTANLTLVNVTLDNRDFMNTAHYAVLRQANQLEIYRPLPEYLYEVPEPAISVARGCTLNLTIGGTQSNLFWYDVGEYGRSAIDVPYGSLLNITKNSTGTLYAYGGRNAAAIGTCFAVCPITYFSGEISEPGDQTYVWMDEYNQIHDIIDQNDMPRTQTGGTIEIAGGVIHAFGGGWSSCGVDVTISGGDIEAIGDGGAAIGMCANGQGIYYNNIANINITGGNLKLSGAPALGCDGEQYQVTTTISGGNITLTDTFINTFDRKNDVGGL